METTLSELGDLVFRNLTGETLTAAEVAKLQGYQGGSMSDGLALQVSVLERLEQMGESVGGYKIGFTSRGSRDKLGPGFRPFGFVLKRHIYPSNSTVDFSHVRSGHLEQEICLVLGRRLAGADVTPEEARDAVIGVAPAFELNEKKRVPGDASAVVRLGSVLNICGLIVGLQRSKDLDLHKVTVSFYKDGSLIDSGGASRDVLDDPYQSLASAARNLAQFGRGFEPGDRVITGTILKSVPMETGVFSASFEGIGTVTVDLCQPHPHDGSAVHRLGNYS